MTRPDLDTGRVRPERFGNLVVALFATFAASR